MMKKRLSFMSGMLLTGVMFFVLSCTKDGGDKDNSVRMENVSISSTIEGQGHYTLTDRNRALEYKTTVTIPAGSISWQAPTFEQTFHEYMEVSLDKVYVFSSSMARIYTVKIEMENNKLRVTFQNSVTTSDLDYLSGDSFSLVVMASARRNVATADLEALSANGLATTCRFYDGGQSTATATTWLHPSFQIEDGLLDNVTATSTVNGQAKYTLTKINDEMLYSTTIQTNNKAPRWVTPTFEQTFADVLLLSASNVTVKINDIVEPAVDVTVDNNKVTVFFRRKNDSYYHLESKTLKIEVNTKIKGTLTQNDLHQYATTGFTSHSVFYVAVYDQNVSSDTEVVTDLGFTYVPLDDIRIPVQSATAAFSNSTNPIERSFDGNLNTHWISHFSNTTFPFDVVYSFKDVSVMDYFVYYPKQGAADGRLKRLEVWYTTKGNSNFVKYGDFDFLGENTPKTVEFTPSLIEPTQIKLVLYEGANSTPTATYASIAEMEFYRRDPGGFNWRTIFTDALCWQLKPGITASDVAAISDPLFKDVATKLLNGTYESDFRVQEFRSWQDPSIMATANKTSTYSRRDNPTGIYVEDGDDLVVIVGDIPVGVNLYLESLDMPVTGGTSTRKYTLTSGVNVFKVRRYATDDGSIVLSGNGLLYAIYLTNTGTEPAVKMHFLTGKVNGYFDKARHTAGDWSRLLNAAVGTYFDLVGTYAHLTMPVAKFKEYTPDGLKLINNYDKLVYDEMDFMGLVKYNKMFKNRMYFRYDSNPSGGWMWAGGYETGYVKGTMNTICGFMISNTDIWGPAHEVGHINQTRPGLKWHGMAEVTTNIFSINAQVKFGLQTRPTSSNNYNTFCKNPGSNTIIGGRKAFAASKDVFEQLLMFWQLKLYLVDALGKTDFYKDLFEHYRVTPTLSNSGLTDGVYQLDFVRQACRVANLDLTKFFDTWGLLTAINMNVEDYGNANFVITQKQVDDLKAEIAAANYPQPLHNNIHLITDSNINSNDYK